MLNRETMSEKEKKKGDFETSFLVSVLFLALSIDTRLQNEGNNTGLQIEGHKREEKKNNPLSVAANQNRGKKK